MYGRKNQRARLTIVSYPLRIPFDNSTDDHIMEVLGLQCSGSGAGFGMRDLEFNTKMPLSELKSKLERAGIKAKVTRL